MLFNLLLLNKAINKIIIQLLIRNTIVILAFAIPSGAPMTIEEEQGETTLPTPPKTSKVLPD